MSTFYYLTTVFKEEIKYNGVSNYNLLLCWDCLVIKKPRGKGKTRRHNWIDLLSAVIKRVFRI